MSTLFSTQKKVFHNLFLAFIFLHENLFNYSFPLLSRYIPLFWLSNLLRFYYSPDFWNIKNFFHPREQRIYFPEWLPMTHWGEMLILTIIYTHAESTGKLIAREKGSVTATWSCKWLSTLPVREFSMLFIHKFNGKVREDMKTKYNSRGWKFRKAAKQRASDRDINLRMTRISKADLYIFTSFPNFSFIFDWFSPKRKKISARKKFPWKLSLFILLSILITCCPWKFIYVLMPCRKNHERRKTFLENNTFHNERNRKSQR